MNNTFRVLWRDNGIGVLEVTGTDMWYLEGTLRLHNTDEAKSFEKLASAFNPTEVMKNSEKGTRIILKNEATDDATNALVISLADNSLFVRRVYEAQAIEWLIKNVR